MNHSSISRPCEASMPPLKTPVKEKSTRLSASLLAVVIALGFVLGAPSSASAQSKEDSAAIEKPIRTLINAVRYSRDDLALKMLDGDRQAQILLDKEWSEATGEQKKRFKSLFHQLFAAIAFPQIRDNFEHLETILYEKPEIKGDRASIRSTLVILHPLKKQEIKVEYELKKNGADWQVVDVTILGTGGKSMLTDIKEQQVQQIFAQGGWDHLLGAMETRAKQLEAQQKKGSSK